MPAISLIVLTLALGYAAFRKGGVSPADFNITLLGIGLVAVLHFTGRKRRRPRLLSRTGYALMLVPFACACLQLVPLPLWLISILSPARADLLRSLAPVGGVPDYATLSAVPAATLDMLMEITGCLLVFLVITDLTRQFEEHPWVPALPLVLVALLEGSLGLIQFFTTDTQPIGTYVSRDHFAGLLELCLPFGILHAVAVVRRNSSRFESPAGPALKACALLAASTVIFLAIMLSLSRMGFLAALTAFFVMGSLSLGADQPGLKRWTPVAITSLIIVVAFIYLPTDALIARFSALTTQEVGSEIRAQLWRDTTRLIRAFPVFGCGLGGFESCFQRYKTVAPMYRADYAHNDYMQYCAELGAIGFLAGLAFFVRLFVKTLAAATKSSDNVRYRAQACAGALTAIGLHSFVDFNMYIPANVVVLAWIAGIAAASTDTGVSEKPQRLCAST